MKKFIFALAFILLGFSSTYSQGGLRLGINAGLPIGDAGDDSNFTIQGDIAYLVGLGETFQIGPMAGYTQFFVDEVDDVQFLPIAATARFGLVGLELGADMGYALGLSDGNNGGFYYRPKVGFGFFGLSLIASYTGISVDGGTYSSINVGAEFRL